MPVRQAARDQNTSPLTESISNRLSVLKRRQRKVEHEVNHAMKQKFCSLFIQCRPLTYAYRPALLYSFPVTFFSKHPVFERQGEAAVPTARKKITASPPPPPPTLLPSAPLPSPPPAARASAAALKTPAPLRLRVHSNASEEGKQEGPVVCARCVRRCQ